MVGLVSGWGAFTRRVDVLRMGYGGDGRFMSLGNVKKGKVKVVDSSFGLWEVDRMEEERNIKNGSCDGSSERCDE